MSGQPVKNSHRWAAILGKRGGSVTSPKKAAASRRNGRQGGRPKATHYCELCEAWMNVRVCKACGAQTVPRA